MPNPHPFVRCSSLQGARVARRGTHYLSPGGTGWWDRPERRLQQIHTNSTIKLLKHLKTDPPADHIPGTEESTGPAQNSVLNTAPKGSYPSAPPEQDPAFDSRQTVQ